MESLGTPPAALSTTAKLEKLRDRSLTARGRAWKDGDYLKYRTHLYGANLKMLRPVTPEVDSLLVKGQSMEQSLWQQATADINLEHVEARLKMRNPEAFEALQVARAEEDRRLELEAEERRKTLAALAAADQVVVVEGPSVSTSHTRLVMEADAGEVGRAPLRVENNGSCALYYTFSGVMRDLPKHAQGGGSYNTERFYLSDQSGVLLPGEVKEFVFTFKSDQPGIYEAHWSLDTHPKLPRPVEGIVLRGLAVMRDTKRLDRRLANADMQNRVKTQQVSVAVERIVRSIATPPKGRQQLSSEEERLAMAFYTKNSSAEGPALYYSSHVYAEMAAIYREAHALLNVAPRADHEAPKDAKKHDKGKQPEQTEDPFTESVWNSDLAKLRNIVSAAEKATARPEDEAALEAWSDEPQQKAAALRKRLEHIIEDAKVPIDRRMMVLAVLNEAVKKISGSVMSLAGEAMEEAVAREQERMEEGQEPPKPPPGKKNEPPPPPKYDSEEFVDILWDMAMPDATNHIRSFGKNMQQRSNDVAAYLDEHLSSVKQEIQQRGDAPELWWRKFELLRTRKHLKLPGGPERFAQVGDEQEGESEDEMEEDEQLDREEPPSESGKESSRSSAPSSRPSKQ